MADREENLKRLGITIGQSGAVSLDSPTMMTFDAANPQLTAYGAYAPIRVGAGTTRVTNADLEPNRSTN